MPELTDVTAHLNALGEESLKSLGLAKMTPIGIIQQILEMIHVNLDVPWIGAIAICKIWLRKIPCVIDTWARLYKKVAFYWREVNAIFIKKKLRDEIILQTIFLQTTFRALKSLLDSLNNNNDTVDFGIPNTYILNAMDMSKWFVNSNYLYFKFYPWYRKNLDISWPSTTRILLANWEFSLPN